MFAWCLYIVYLQNINSASKLQPTLLYARLACDTLQTYTRIYLTCLPIVILNYTVKMSKSLHFVWHITI